VTSARLEDAASGFGRLTAVRHAAAMSETASPSQARRIIARWAAILSSPPADGWNLILITPADGLEPGEATRVRLGDDPMRTKWLLIFLLMTFLNVCDTPAQVADIAGVLPGDRWVYEVTDEMTGDVKATRTVVVLDVSESEVEVTGQAPSA
jgi:hypothetical protein